MEKDITTTEITLARSSSSLDELRRFVRESLHQSRLAEYDRGLVSLAIDEIVSAIVEEPPRNSLSVINLRIDVSSVAVKIEIEDTKNIFGNGLTDEISLGEERESDDRREIAIFFICEIMDEIYYTFQKGFENSLVMVKFTK